MFKLLLFLHVVSVVVWVGGMFFAYMALRPAAGALAPPQRLPLWRDTLRRFFLWVWAAVGLIFASGMLMVAHFGGFRAAPAYVAAMAVVGILMMAVFAHVFFAPFRRLAGAVDAADWPAAARSLNQIRLLVATNLGLGFLVLALVFLWRG